MPDRRMLVSFAHPDDETFGMGGSIAKYAAEGVGVYLICSTNGDVGSADPEFMADFDTPADMRLSELACAAETLGIKEVITLGYRDSGMAGTDDNHHPNSLYQADLAKVAGQITEAIRRVRPQVVVTFDPFGGYGHPDHIVMHEATKHAYRAAGDPSQYADQVAAGLEAYQPSKLYFRTNRRSLLRARIAMMRLTGKDPERVGRNKDVDLKEIAAHEYPIHAIVDTQEYAEVAERARHCHASQIYNFGRPGFWDTLGRFLYGHSDTYMRSDPAVNGNRMRESDLFDGLTL